MKLKGLLTLLAVLLVLTCGAVAEAPAEPTPCPEAEDTSSESPSRDAVQALQEKLVELGYLTEAPSGVMDDSTQAAWAAFQADNGLESVAAYIGNRNTHKFHRPDCNSVGEMKESNKVEFATREEAVEQGYVPCKRCNP